MSSPKTYENLAFFKNLRMTTFFRKHVSRRHPITGLSEVISSLEGSIMQISFNKAI